MDEAERIRRADRVRAVFDVYGLKPSRANRDELIREFRKDADATLPFGPRGHKSAKGPSPEEVFRDVETIRRRQPELKELPACEKARTNAPRKYDGITTEAVRARYREAWNAILNGDPFFSFPPHYAGAKGRERMPQSVVEFIVDVLLNK